MGGPSHAKAALNKGQKNRIPRSNGKGTPMNPAKPLPAAELIAGNLKRLRDERGLSLEDVVRLTGISATRLEASEAATARAHFDEVGLVALALGVRIATLFAAE